MLDAGLAAEPGSHHIVEAVHGGLVSLYAVGILCFASLARLSGFSKLAAWILLVRAPAASSLLDLVGLRLPS